MKTRRSHIITAGALLIATAVIGTIARGSGPAAAPTPSNGETQLAAPAGGPVSFSGRLDRKSVLLGSDGKVRLELVLAARADRSRDRNRLPADMVIVLDRSGSMAGEKIENARAAVRALTAQLTTADRFALVTYSSNAAVTVPLSSVGDGRRATWMTTLAQIAANGNTNISGGLDLAFDLIESARSTGRMPHVVLISDGLANAGDASRPGLTARARRAARGEYVLSTVGVGDDFDEQLMSALADAGTGNYYYLRNSRDLASVFADELGAAATTVASGLTVEIQPGPGVRVVDAAGYPLERKSGRILFRPGSLFAGQNRRIWVTLAVSPKTEGELNLGRFSLAYNEHDRRTTLAFSENPRIACVADTSRFYADVDVPVWSRAVASEKYNAMQQAVADDVRQGRRDEALKRIREFKRTTIRMNEQLHSPPVAAQVNKAGRLEAEVAAAFRGEHQALHQKRFSKSSAALAKDGRRRGAKWQAPASR